VIAMTVIDREPRTASPTTKPSQPPRSAKRTRTRRLPWTESTFFRTLAPILVGFAAFLVWEIGVRISNPSPTILPSPLRVFEAASERTDELWLNTVPTAQVALLGLAFSILISVALATAMAFVPFLRNATLPVLIAAQSIPIIVLAPLFVIWFGFGIGPKIALIVIASALPMTIALLQGFLSADSDAMVLMKSLGANRAKIFLRLQVPSSLPFFFTGLRVIASFAVLAAIFAETVGAQSGLGIYMSIQKNLLRTDLVLAAAIITILMGLALFVLTYVLEALAMPWERRRKAMRSE
jgi:ABC-type nitrate/sulfonate/bicarbonate transport system permease component